MTATLLDHDLQSHSPQWIKQQFLQKAIAQMKSTDGIYQLKDYKSYFKNQDGRILSEAVDKLVQAFLNPSELTSDNQKKLNEFKTKWHNKLGTLTEAQQQKLRLLEKYKKHDLWIQQMTDLAISEGQLTEVIYPLKNVAGKTWVTPMAERSLSDYLSKVKHYCDEFLTPAIAHAEKTGTQKLTPDAVQTMRQFLFQETQQNWLTKLFKINPKDGLLRIAYKQKLWITAASVAVSMAIGVSVVYLNNWLTRRRFNNKVFFPGEQALIERDIKKHVSAQQAIHTANYQSRFAGHPSQSVRFGNLAVKAPAFLKIFDFMNLSPYNNLLLSQSTPFQNKVMYAGVISSRVKNVRSANEKRETMFRDFLGWYFWLFGMPLFLILTVKGLGRFKPALKDLLMVDKQFHGNWFKRALNWIIAPNKLYGIHTIEQVEQRYRQLHRNIMNLPQVTEKERQFIHEAQQKFLEAAKRRGDIQILTFLTNLIILGVGVIGLNIAMTNKNVQKKVASGELDKNEPILENRRRQKAHERNYRQPNDHLGLLGRSLPMPSAPAFATSMAYQPFNTPTMISAPAAAWPMPPQVFAPYSPN